MYSSGGDLHLELPSGETEGPQALWQIPPYQTKSVMKANFVARMENNHTAYIRWVLNVLVESEYENAKHSFLFLSGVNVFSENSKVEEFA